MGSSERIERRAAEWLAQRDSAAWDAHAQAAFDAWLEAATAHRVAVLRLESAWRESARLQALAAGRPGTTSASGSDTDPAPALADDRRRPAVAAGAGPRRRRAAGLALASGLAAGLALVLWWQLPAASQSQAPVRYATHTGAIRSLALADGSQTTLSSGSAIDVHLAPHERSVTLDSGEAFFQVSHDPDRPFIVNVDGQQVVAVGTRFSVRRDASGLRVIVTEGLVRLQPRRKGGARQATTLLPAGSIALSGPDGMLVRTGTVRQAEEALSWRDGLLSFKDTPLETAIGEFNRYNVRKLVVTDPDIGALRIGGSFRWSNAEAFARLMERGFPVRAEFHEDRIELHRR